MEPHVVKHIDLTDIMLGENSRLQIGDDDLADLMESINKQGLMCAVNVVKLKPAPRNGKKYKLIAGFRRFAAFKKLKLTSIPAKIEKRQLTRGEEIAHNLIENDKRKSIDQFEYGRYCNLLIEEEKYTPGEAAALLCTKVSRVNSSIKIFKNIPEKFAGRIKALSAGEKNPRGGLIHPTKAKLAVEMMRKYKITEEQLTDLLERIARDKSLSHELLKQAMMLMSLGSSLDSALRKVNKYAVKRIDVCVSKKDLEVLKKLGKGSISKILQNIIYNSGAIKDPRVGAMKNE